MPRQNRVTPLGELIAHPSFGLVYGNRGCLHDGEGRIRRHHNGKRWIACRLQFRGWQRQRLMAPGRYTELFFLDDATALAAGHRPCALCRHEDYRTLMARWRELHPGQRDADAIDAQLHRERAGADGPPDRRCRSNVADLPDGAFVLDEGEPCLVLGSRLLSWTPDGYRPRRRAPARDDLLVITPPSLVSVLRAGWDPLVPFIHPSADA
jgi:hypothetical protein